MLIIPLGHKGENSIELLATLTHSLTNFHKIEIKDEKKDTAEVTVTIREQKREKRKCFIPEQSQSK